MLSIIPTSQSARVTSRTNSSHRNGLTFSGQSMTSSRHQPASRNTKSQDHHKQKVVQSVTQNQYGPATDDTAGEPKFDDGNHSIPPKERGKHSDNGLEMESHTSKEPRRRRKVEFDPDRNRGGTMSSLDDETFNACHKHMIEDVMQTPITPPSTQFHGSSGKLLGVEVASSACDKGECSTGTDTFDHRYEPLPLKYQTTKRSSLPNDLGYDKKEKSVQYPHKNQINERSFFNGDSDEEGSKKDKSSATIRPKTSSSTKTNVQSGLAIERPKSMCASIDQTHEQVLSSGNLWSKPLPPLPRSEEDKTLRTSLPTIRSNESLRVFSSHAGHDKNAQSSISKQAPVRKDPLPTHKLLQPIPAGEKVKSAVPSRKVQRPHNAAFAPSEIHPAFKGDPAASQGSTRKGDELDHIPASLIKRMDLDSPYLGPEMRVRLREVKTRHVQPSPFQPAQVEAVLVQPGQVRRARVRPTRVRPTKVQSAQVQPAPIQPAPVQPASVRPAPVQSAPVRPASVRPASVRPASVRPASVRPASVRPAPVRPASVRPAPVRPASVRPAPVRPASVRPAPVRPAPFQPAPAHAAPIQAGPIQATPVHAAPVQPIPVQAAPIQAAPVHAAPVQPTPVQAAPNQAPNTSPATPLSSSSTLVQPSAPAIETTAAMKSRLAKKRVEIGQHEAEEEAEKRKAMVTAVAAYFMNKNALHLFKTPAYIPRVLKKRFQLFKKKNYTYAASPRPLLPGSGKMTRIIDTPAMTTRIIDFPRDVAFAQGAYTAYDEHSLIKIAERLGLEALKDGGEIQKVHDDKEAVERKKEDDLKQRIVAEGIAKLRASMGDEGLALEAEEMHPTRFSVARTALSLKTERAVLGLRLRCGRYF